MSVYLAFDFECVVDAPLARKVYGHAGTDAEVREQVRQRTLEKTQGRSDFPKPLLWQVCAVGVAGYAVKTGKQKVEAMAGADERVLLAWFLSLIAARPQLVTFNGRGFDMPVLLHRALIHELDTHVLAGDKWDKGWEKYSHRYDGPHLDIGDALTGFGGSGMATLDELAVACGLAGKRGVSGGMVEGFYEASNWDALRDYVGRDAEDTLALGLRFERTRGRLTPPVASEAAPQLEMSPA